jgi:hypothetical protein
MVVVNTFEYYESMIGKKVKKTSDKPKPFKSGFKINTVKDIVRHEFLDIPAFTFEEDDSYVECRRCVLANEEEDLIYVNQKGKKIFAIQWSGNWNKQKVEQFVGKELVSILESETAYVAGQGPPIFSLEWENANVYRGNWFIKNHLGNIEVMSNEKFQESYRKK